MTKQINTLNTISGQVGLVPATYLNNPVLGRNLVEVPEGTKSYDPEFYQPTDREGDAAKPTRGRRKTTGVSEVVDEIKVGDDPTLDFDLQ